MKKLEHYAKVSDLRSMLPRSPQSGGRELLYIVPSHANDAPLLDLIRGYGTFFGARPRVWSWSEIYTAVVPRSRIRRQIDPPDHMLILRHIVDGALADMDSRGEHVPSGARRRGFADILSRSIRELLLEDIAPDTISGVEGGELLYRLYSDYVSYLDGHGLADNGQIPTLTREDADSDLLEELAGHVEMIWVGFMSFTGTQRKLIEHIDRARGRGAVMKFFVPYSFLDGFHDAGRQLFPNTDQRMSKISELAVFRAESEDTYAQYDAAAAEIARLLDGTSDLFAKCAELSSAKADVSDIGVLTARGRGGSMLSALRKLDIPCVSMSETAVCDTHLIETMRTAWSLYCDGWPTRRTVSFLASPIFGIPRIDMRDISSAMPEGEDAWREFLSDQPSAICVFERAVRFCAAIDDPEGRSPAEVFDLLLDLFDKEWGERVSSIVGEKTDLDEHVRAVYGALSEAEAKRALLEEQEASLGPAAKRKLRGAEAIAYIMSWADEAATALPMPQRNIVKVYERTPSILVSHDIWMMTDVDASAWSGSVSEDALIGADVRSCVNGDGDVFDGARDHLPTMTEKRQQSEALFRRMAASGDVCTIMFSARKDESGKELAPSPFSEAMFEMLCEAGGKSRSDMTIKPKDQERTVPRRERGSFPRALRHSLEGRLSVGPSSADVWRECRFKFCLDHVIKVSSDRFEPLATSPRIQGSIMHEIWHDVCRSCLLPNDAGGPKLLAAAFLAKWSEIDAELGPRSFIVKERLKRRMLKCAELMDRIEREAAGYGIIRTSAPLLEHRMEPMDIGPLTIRGIADRVDVWDIGDVIVDYKSGAASAYQDSAQLACYAAMLRAEGRNVVGWCWIGHKDGRAIGVWKTPELKSIYQDESKDKDDMPADIESAVSDALALLSEMSDGVMAGTYQANYESKMCRYCDHVEICRRAEVVGEPYSMEGEDDGR